MSAAPGETASANRRLLNGHPFGAGDLPLLISQQLGVDFDNGLMQAGGSAGLYVRDSGVNRLGWRASSGATDYILTDAAGDHDSGIPLTTNGQHLEFTLTGPATYTLDVTPTGGTTSHFTGLLSGIQFGQIDEVQLFDSGAGTAPANDVYFNNLSFTPEPSFAALIGTAASLLASRHSCRKMR